MKLATWNVNSLKVRLPHVLEWLIQTQTDVLCIQETKQENHNFSHAAFREIGYHSYHNGQKTYNGVAIVSKKALVDVQLDIPNYSDEQKRFISGKYPLTASEFILIVSAYIPNGQSLESEKFIYKRNWLKAFISHVTNLKKKFSSIAITGDFNIAPEDIDCHDPSAWDGQVLVSNIERDFFKEIINLGFFDAYRSLNPDLQEFSWWDYRMASFRRNLGMRIDHILLSNEERKKVNKALIDKGPRKLERPSDHTPVIIEIN